MNIERVDDCNSLMGSPILEAKEGVVEENTDEKMGYIMRRAREEYGIDLYYSELRAILSVELKYHEGKITDLAEPLLPLSE